MRLATFRPKLFWQKNKRSLSMLMSVSSMISLTVKASTGCEKNASAVPPRFGERIPRKLLAKDSSDGRSSSNDFTSKIPLKDRNECVICKKYSKGPCGELFTAWLNCVDANNSETSACDDLIAEFDKCLKKNESYYENVDIHHDEDFENENKWKSFILELEAVNDEQITQVKEFSKRNIPEMQFRLRDKMGVIMFHPKYMQGDSEKLLILGYVKDQNDVVLAGASSDELIEYGGKLMLRFRTNEISSEVKACAIYMSPDKKKIDEVVIYQRIERIPLYKNP